MIIDIIVAIFVGVLLDPFLGGKGHGLWVILVLVILFFVGWLYRVIKLSKNESKTGMWVTSLVGLFVSFLIGWITSLFFESKPKEIEEENFYCSFCYITYNKDLFGGKTDSWRKICRYCLDKKHKDKDDIPKSQVDLPNANQLGIKRENNNQNMNNQNNLKIIEFIETREALTEARWNKQRAINKIYGGLFGVGNFALYYGLEHYFLKEFVETIRATNPYFKYVFWISIAFAVWGGIRTIWGLVNYFQSNSKVDVLEMKVEQLKKELIY